MNRAEEIVIVTLFLCVGFFIGLHFIDAWDLIFNI